MSTENAIKRAPNSACAKLRAPAISGKDPMEIDDLYSHFLQCRNAAHLRVRDCEGKKPELTMSKIAIPEVANRCQRCHHANAVRDN
jgi:hypothetical protein